MARYLTDLADVLRAAGLTVIEVDGWETRARSSGGYADGRPTHLLVHHTASPQRTDGQRDVDYIVSGSPVKPVANIYTDRQGVVWVCAAGATNTNGRGGPLDGVPADSMNLYAISNEIANTGTGEPYPAVQQQSVLTSSAAICRAYGIDVDNVRGHFEWTSRKIDPSGPSMWAASGKWDMDEFRADVAATLAAQTTTPPTTDDEDDAMFRIRYTDSSYKPGAYTGLICNGTQLGWIGDGHADIALGKGGARVVDDLTTAELDGLIKTLQTTSKCPPEWVNTPRGAAWTANRG
jgi:hypothetical protein